MHPSFRLAHRGFSETQIAAKTLGIQLQPVEADPSQFDAAFTTVMASRADAVIVMPHPSYLIERQRFVELATRHRLPTMVIGKESVEAGSLMSLDAGLADTYQLLAEYVDKILKGVKPNDLPVRRPTKFYLVINLKTAKTLGLTIPPAVLARADEVIHQ